MQVYTFNRSVIYTDCFYWIGCGLAPTVTLNCMDRFAHVDWVASQPGCQFDCKAYWTCANGINVPYQDEVGSQ